MHVYIYDAFVNEKKYEKLVARIETRITDLGLNGKIVRLGLSTNIFSTIENEIKKGAKTIIVVGNNNIYNQGINAIARLRLRGLINHSIPLGFIPVDNNNNRIGKYFGINNYEEACNFISARRIETIGLGLANDYYFLAQARITSNGTLVEINKEYSVEILEPGEIYIINLPTEIDLPEVVNFSNTDEQLKLFIQTDKGKTASFFSKKFIHKSFVPFRELFITNKNSSIILDGSIEIKTPVHIRRSKEKISLIVGKPKLQ